MTTDDLDALKQQLVRHEGFKLKVYFDSLGIPTIGVGRNLRDKGISATTATQMLDEDIAECLTDLGTFAWFADLDPIRQRALVDLRFNLGPSRLRGFRQLLDACARGDFAAASRELLDSRWARQVQPRRRDTLVRQLRDGGGGG